MLISIDHGNKMIKTCNSEPFTGGLVENEVKPFGADVLQYKGNTNPQLKVEIRFEL